MPQLIAKLRDGPIDIIGDIHGEINALRLLLWHLGYDKQGSHPEGRRLVFLGDLVDRGPDSPAVLELIKQFVQANRAQCILGNHELNLLRGSIKDGNDWFTNPLQKGKFPFKAVSSEQKQDFVSFLESLPLALERDDLRVVHACWHSKSVRRLSQSDSSKSVVNAYDQYDNEFDSTHIPQGMTKSELNQVLSNQKEMPDFMPDLAKHETDYQMGNPIRVLTSGEEAPASEPFWAGGKWRMVSRQKWWESYDEEPTVIMGHYWRRSKDVVSGYGDKHGPDLFEGIEPHHWMGQRKNVYCVDFSVGLRHRARADSVSKYMFKLAAVRWPETSVMYDDGSCIILQ